MYIKKSHIQEQCKMSRMLLSFIFVLSVLTKALEATDAEDLIDFRIVGKDDDDTGKPIKYPYQALVTFDTHRCGGSIISEEYILTAAHCVRDVQPETFRVRVGSLNYRTGGQVYKVSEKHYHPRYYKKIYDYDVGILKTSEKMKIDNINTMIVKLPDSGPCDIPVEKVKISGWGLIMEHGSPSDILRAVTVSILPRERCSKAFEGTSSVFTKRMFCAGWPGGGKDSCNGDSGGPAVHEATGVQYGVVSWGRGCARERFPGVYTCIPTVRDWIREKTGI